MAAIELWGGLEGTVNRVGERFFDQCAKSGHASRPEDIALIAQTGIRAIRYPFVWENAVPHGDASRADWRWADERLPLIRRAGMRPIAGLLHHGSGPSCTNLLDPDFPARLAEYAAAFARRYPWVVDYTPVNEPLTTARFSALYGFWYPHARDEESFLQALVNQCRAVVLCMREIRKINPEARLVQTEDLGTVMAAPSLAYQADFENQRRWLSLDLLCGKMDERHPLWKRSLSWLDESQLRFFLENPCPPDVVGINYYITSDRYLDDRIDRYPPERVGGNGRDAYVDIETARIAERDISGHQAALTAAWKRYGLPVAITEVQIDSTREDQLRWFYEAWRAAKNAASEGADVRAVTAWALLGSHDWNSLVTAENGHYESGVFDLRGGKPRPTALVGLLRELAEKKDADHPVLSHLGWWRRPCRWMSEKVRNRYEAAICKYGRSNERPILITGGTGTLGRAFSRSCERRGLSYRILSRGDMDIADEDSVKRVFDAIRPWAVVNAAGYVRVDDAEREKEKCFRENVRGAENLARASESARIPFLTFSSDLVFDGSRGSAYVETDAVRPLGVYGRSKAEAEMKVLAACRSALVVRSSAFFGPWDEYNFLTQTMKQWSMGIPVHAPEDGVVTPTYVPELVRVCLDLLIDGEKGIRHLSNPDEVTWAGWAMRLAKMTGYPAELVRPCTFEALGYAAPRPKFSALASAHGRLMPPLEHSLERYLDDSEHDWVSRAPMAPGTRTYSRSVEIEGE